ncbi:MAG: T9SS type A sorting domain-containing protein [Ignavibacteria bacterium]|nr:T9SS type A sorting domain-containing protein [Ignavibacteria bacterium]
MSSKGGYASGVYFYTLTAGKFTATKKFILMK